MSELPLARIITGDALEHIGTGWQSVFTSIPDSEEVGMTIAEWQPWWLNAAQKLIEATDPNGYVVFYQADRRVNGGLVSKSEMAMRAALAAGARPIWHKISIATTKTLLRRPSYSHLICVSRKGRSGKPSPDVFMKGVKVYKNATDTIACDVVMDFLKLKGITSVVDPFCGQGSIGYAAARHGMDSLNIDILAEQTDKAAELIGGVARVERS